MSYPKSVYGAAEQLETEMTEVLATMLSKNAKNLTDVDLNTQIGSIIIGYGNGCINKPTGTANGYFINIPHSSINNYNKQFYIERTNNRIWTRYQENGTFGEWVMIGAEETNLNSNVLTNRTFNGERVYCKTVNIGNLPNNTTKEVASGLRPEEIFVLEIRGSADGSDDWLPLPNVHPNSANNISCYLRADGKVVVATGKDRSTMTGRVQIYYIQNT